MNRLVLHRLGQRVSRIRCFSSQLAASYENIQVEIKDGQVGLIRLHRPQALNALSDGLFQDVLHAAQALDQDEDIGCLILTGSSKAFAAGADISEMQSRSFDQVYSKVGSLIGRFSKK